MEGVSIVHPIVPEGCDQSRALRVVCGGGTHHPVLGPCHCLHRIYIESVQPKRTLSAVALWRGLRDVGTEMQACSSTKIKHKDKAGLGKLLVIELFFFSQRG